MLGRVATHRPPARYALGMRDRTTFAELDALVQGASRTSCLLLHRSKRKRYGAPRGAARTRLRPLAISLASSREADFHSTAGAHPMPDVVAPASVFLPGYEVQGGRHAHRSFLRQRRSCSACWRLRLGPRRPSRRRHRRINRPFSTVWDAVICYRPHVRGNPTSAASAVHINATASWPASLGDNLTASPYPNPRPVSSAGSLREGMDTRPKAWSQCCMQQRSLRRCYCPGKQGKMPARPR